MDFRIFEVDNYDNETYIAVAHDKQMEGSWFTKCYIPLSAGCSIVRENDLLRLYGHAPREPREGDLLRVWVIPGVRFSALEAQFWAFEGDITSAEKGQVPFYLWENESPPWLRDVRDKLECEVIEMEMSERYLLLSELRRRQRKRLYLNDSGFLTRDAIDVVESVIHDSITLRHYGSAA